MNFREDRRRMTATRLLGTWALLLACSWLAVIGAATVVRTVWGWLG